MAKSAVDIHQRRSIRLKGYDYTRAGAYFVTVVTWQRGCLFGEIAQGRVVLLEAGKIAQEEWIKTGEIRPNVEVYEDEFIIMPNHVHGIIWITDPEDYAGRRDEIDGGEFGEARWDLVGAQQDIVGAQRRCAPTGMGTRTTANVVPGSLGAIVRAFKSATTRRINAGNGTPGAPVWQRNYYEHIIRDEGEWEEIKAYIRNNPIEWELDFENPYREVAE